MIEEAPKWYSPVCTPIDWQIPPKQERPCSGYELGIIQESLESVREQLAQTSNDPNLTLTTSCDFDLSPKVEHDRLALEAKKPLDRTAPWE